MNEASTDLRGILLRLYVSNNPQLEHSIFIYSYRGVVDFSTNPFSFVGGKLHANVKKSIVLQNLASGEMMQTFIVPAKDKDGRASFQIENTAVYGNKSGTLLDIDLQNEKISRSEKYKQFTLLASSLLRQFQL